MKLAAPAARGLFVSSYVSVVVYVGGGVVVDGKKRF